MQKNINKILKTIFSNSVSFIFIIKNSISLIASITIYIIFIIFIHFNTSFKINYFLIYTLGISFLTDTDWFSLKIVEAIKSPVIH